MSHHSRKNKDPTAASASVRAAETFADATGQQHRAGEESSSQSAPPQEDGGDAERQSRMRIDRAHKIVYGPDDAESIEHVGKPEPERAERERAEPSGPDSEAAADSATDSAADEVFSPRMLEQLRLQTEQLASHLRAQQYQLDRREGQLNAQQAQLENDARGARLWLRERQQELAEREAELARRRQEIEARQNQYEPPPAARGQSASRAPVPSLPAGASEFAQLAIRQQNLEEAEALLADGQAALESGRKQLAAQRQALAEERESETARLAEERRRTELELDKRLQAIKNRSEQVERRGGAAEQLRTEVLRAQRETLELRLATDEIWAQISGTIPPAMLTQSLARTRSKLADQYRFERAELAQQQEQLESLAGRLDAQREKLQRQRQEIERWTADRRGEIEGQAARLVAKERQLARQQAELEESRAGQERERQLYEAEIRRLLSELRRNGPDSRAA